VTSVGFNKYLYLLPFDQPACFQAQIFGWHGALTAGQTTEIISAKQVIYDGFKAAIATGVRQDRAGIIVDEKFGASILRDALARGYITACPAEKSCQQEFDFEYGKEFRHHIEAIAATFCKVLVHYDADGDTALKRRDVSRLKRLSEYLRGKGRLFMCDLRVPMRTLGPKLMVQAIHELQNSHVEPDVWKIEGLDRRVAAIRRGPRKKVGCIISGLGEDDLQMRRWLTTAAGVPGIIGFATGPATFREPLHSWWKKKISRQEAVAAIARRYRSSVDIFEGKVRAAA
jgi:myo-inositol catabolism protein IolC